MYTNKKFCQISKYDNNGVIEKKFSDCSANKIELIHSEIVKLRICLQRLFEELQNSSFFQLIFSLVIFETNLLFCISIDIR